MRRLLVATIVVVALGLPAWSQPQGPGAPDYWPAGDVRRGPVQNQDNGPDNGDAPDRGVARISVINGNVSVRRGDSADLVAAALNAPIVATDRLVTGDGSRAEVQFDSANMVRLAPSTEVRFSELAYRRYQVQVAAGMVTFRVLRNSNAQVEISTPSVSVRPEKIGIYRVLVRPDGTSEITVRAGDAEIFSPAGSQQLHAGQTMMARGSATDPEYQEVAAIPQDEWDRWNSTRDGELERTRSPRYVSPDVYGTEDLDANGRWVNDPQYGTVWVPTVDPGWAPYQAGRWVWIDYYGWTWVSDDPWGWAPYHYGRWYYGGFGWAWYPGPIVSRYYWRPALVGFFGWGAPGVGIGLGFGFGNVGWVPLAPFEAFRPWYGRGLYGAGFRNGAIVNETNIASVYRNARVANGVSGMRAGEFGRSAVTRGNLVRASAGDLSRAGLVRGQMPIAPSRESTQFSNRAASTQGAPRTSDNTRFVSSRQPSQVSRVPFEQQRQSMSGAGSNNGFRSAEPPGGQSSGGWQRFNPSTQGARPGYSNPQGQVRVSPPIVSNRGGVGGQRPAATPRSSAPQGGARGGSRGGGGGSRGGGRR